MGQATYAARAASTTESTDTRMTGPPPLNTSSPAYKIPSSTSVLLQHQAVSAVSPAQRSISVALSNLRVTGEESPVMNETLSVIDEHITDMNTPRSSLLATDRKGNNDSSSEYSNHIDHRLSYIAGNETDEEERSLHTRKQILSWGPEQVEDCLKDLGVEPEHCEVFREQDITGEVLLSMDQASLFLKEFDLGLVGRRLRTWHKIKAFQDEVQANERMHTKGLEPLTAKGSSEHLRNSSIKPFTKSLILPQIPSYYDTSAATGSQFTKEKEIVLLSPSTSPQLTQSQRNEANSTPASFNTFASSPESPRRPSAASVREYNHSRRHSAIDFIPSMRPEYSLDRSSVSTPVRAITPSHKKAPSLDRNWTMSGSIPTVNGRPQTVISQTAPLLSKHSNLDPKHSDTAGTTVKDVDRGYFSGSELEPKKIRNVLRKRDVASANYSRQVSTHEDYRRSTPGSKRHSRFGSVEAIRDTVAAIATPASKIYHGNSVKGRPRNASIKEVEALKKSRFSEVSSPTVTKLQYDEKPRVSLVTRSSSTKVKAENASTPSPLSSTAHPESPEAAIKPRIGLRAISDAVTGSEKALMRSPSSVSSPHKDSAAQSPARTGSTTPSGASLSIDLESTDASSKGTGGAPTGFTHTSGTIRRKTKKATSAYVRGLESKTPQEQMIGCDYSGWMKKKSSNLMKTWKTRLFVLRGRRLSYYYSENDTQEKGLIDISFHRVLPADNDLLTGFHATVTGAKSSPVSPSNAQTATLAAAEAAATPESTLRKSAGDSMFIFKLVPPRSGLSRAVNFTKPTVHYFAVENVIQGRLWMAALMKATIDRDEAKPITTTYQQKTISLVKARAMRHRPPALMGLDEKQEVVDEAPKSDETGLNIQGVNLEYKRTGSLNVEPEARSDPPETPQGKTR